MSIANDLIKAITATSRGSARSLQVNIGPSEIGGCRRATWNRLHDVTKTNPNTLGLAGIMGTAIHAYIHEAFEKQDPFNDRYLLEHEVAYGDLMGHVDMYDIEKMEVVDWKTTKKVGLAYFPSKQQRWQVQLYGYLLEKNNKPVKTVTLVAIPRDGDERDIVYHSEPYDESIALEALEWLRDVKATELAPAPERDLSFCKLYCVYYDSTGEVGCPSRPKAEAEGQVITDEIAVSAAQTYIHILGEEKRLQRAKDAAKDALEGVNGITPDGIKVYWSSVAGRKSIDESKVIELLGDIPVKYGNETFRLNVKGSE